MFQMALLFLKENNCANFLQSMHKYRSYGLNSLLPCIVFSFKVIRTHTALPMNTFNYTGSNTGSDLAFNPLDDLLHEELEATWIESLLPKTKPIVCGVVYRLPQQANLKCLSSSFFPERECIILGDFNTDVAKSKRCNLVKSLCAFKDMFNVFQIIKEPTRISTNSSSTIDLILVSDEDKISQTGVLHLGISDHSLIYCTRRVVKAAINKHNTVKLRSMKNYDKDTFQVNLLNADWSSVLISDNACDAWEKFKSNFTSLVHDIAPIKEVRIKQRTEPWVNDEILQSIKDRDKAFQTFKNDSLMKNLQFLNNFVIKLKR